MSTILRRIALTTLVVMAALCTPHTTSAQSDPGIRICTPDCFDDPWQSVDNILYEPIHCNGAICQVRIHYAIRNACDHQYWDFQVHQIDLLDPTCNVNCSNAQILSESIYDLLMYDHVAVEQPNNDGCITNWRVSIGACWRRTELTLPIIGTVTVLVPCEPGVCCLTRYLTCRDHVGHKTVYPQGPPPPDPDCAPDGPYECFPACSDTWLNIIGKGSSPHESSREAVEMLTFSASGPSSILCNAIERSTAHLEIVDITGRVILTAETEPDADLRCRFSIDLRGLHAGTYLCRVVNGGRNVMQSPILATR